MRYIIIDLLNERKWRGKWTVGNEIEQKSHKRPHDIQSGSLFNKFMYFQYFSSVHNLNSQTKMACSLVKIAELHNELSVISDLHKSPFKPAQLLQKLA